MQTGVKTTEEYKAAQYRTGAPPPALAVEPAAGRVPGLAEARGARGARRSKTPRRAEARGAGSIPEALLN